VRVIFRADASLDIGLGHVMRCLTLAQSLSNLGFNVEFISREHNGNMNDSIESKGFKLYSLPGRKGGSTQSECLGYGAWLGVDSKTDVEQSIQCFIGEKVDLLVVDHYALDVEWEKLVRPYVKRIMVIDDLANRHHDCDVLLDQTYGRRAIDYASLVPSNCTLLLGSTNALLRPEFAALRPRVLKRREAFSGIKHIMVSMGGLDEANVTASILNALRLVAWETPPAIDIVLTSKSPFLEEISKLALHYPYTVNLQIDATNMAELMLRADLAIGAGGTTSWERCSMALPTILIVLADNQKVIGESLMQAGATVTLQEDEYLQNNIRLTIERLLLDAEMYADLSINSSIICDGMGAIRVAKKMLQ